MSLASRLVELGAFKTGSFRLASGKTSDFYIDLKESLQDPAFLSAVALHARSYTPGHDAVAGAVLGGVPFATAIAMEAGLPLVLVRPEPKAHGTSSQVEGRVAEGQRVLVIEDVVTTGGSVVKAIQALRAGGVEVSHVLTIVDRGEGGREALKDAGVALHALVTIDELRAASAGEVVQ